MWWWSSGQRDCLHLRRSEFGSRCCLQFFGKIVVEKSRKNKKRPGLAHLKKVSFDCWASLIEMIFLLVLLSTKNQQNAETIFGVKVQPESIDQVLQLKSGPRLQFSSSSKSRFSPFAETARIGHLKNMELWSIIQLENSSTLPVCTGHASEQIF